MKIDTPNVFKLLKSALIAGGYDGLCRDADYVRNKSDCGCLINDLCPCNYDDCLLPELCQAGWKHTDVNGNWYISREKEEE